MSFYEAISDFIDNFNKLLNRDEIRQEYINLLLTTLSKDKSHVTLKLRQVLNMQESNFFNNLTIKGEKNVSVGEDEKIVYYSVKKDYLSQDKNLTVEEIPNAFFEPIFKFNKINHKKPFELKYLSSGEQQLLHSTISISYHIDNLLSIVENEKTKENKQDRLRYYKYINIVLDEIELYYHPDYQREYISNLRMMLSQKKYEELNFNIIFSTHSPFILSDIPTQNTLKLKDGIPVKNGDGINSFGANIHDLLADEFFLAGGFMGEFALNKIKNIYEKVNEEEITNSNYQSFLLEINLIGEVVLKKPLLELLDNKLQQSISDKKKLVDYYQNIINKINNQ